MKRNGYIVVCFFIIIRVTFVFAQSNAGAGKLLPDIPGYRTLCCDFHMHTVFSDGSVWPTVRVEEAWQEGLDAIAITDHIEYRPHKDDMTSDFNRSFSIAADSRPNGVVVIKGSEITRAMPPGHFNAIFLQDSNPLDTELYMDAIQAAADQSAFIFWNHPGWRQPDTKPIWYEEHTELFEKGLMHGIEIVNDREYYPEAFQYCLDKNLTLMGNSDVHSPIHMAWDLDGGEKRPMTVVFAREKSIASIKEALFDRRTAVYFEKKLFGHEPFLVPLINQCLQVKNVVADEKSVFVEIYNCSFFDYKCMIKPVEGISAPEKLTFYDGKKAGFTVKFTDEVKGRFVLPLLMENVLIAPEKGLFVEYVVSAKTIMEGSH
ncbi:histidinol-phosphatase [candidate division KSB1 bacterium]|nr:histidinol-phosphatase [candidate division KSB1 bacterium]